MATKRDKRVVELAGQFADHNDVLNRLWVLGYPVERLQNALARSPEGTNDTTDIIARLINDGLSPDTLLAARQQEIRGDQYNWPFTKVGKGVQPPNHMESAAPTPGPAPNDRQLGVRGQGGGPAPPPGSAGRPAPPPGGGPVGGAATGGGGGGGGGGNRGGGAPPPAPPRKMTPAEIETEVRRRYGGFAWMLDDPGFSDVRAILMKAGEEGWDPLTLEANLKDTQFFKTHDASSRKYETMLRTDTTTLNSLIETNRQKMAAIAQAMGVTLDPNRLLEMAQNSVRQNWTTEFQFNSAIAAEAQYRPDYGGQIGSYETAAKGIARDYLYKIDDETAFNFARDIAAGKITEETVTEHFKAQAKGLLGPDYEAQIDAGLKPRDLLSGQINTIANLLEVDAETLDLVNDSRLQGIVQTTDPNGKRRPKTVSETAEHVKKLDDWWKTQNANKEVGEKASYIGKLFGRTV